MALHRHSNALVGILPPDADASVALLGDTERPDVTYADIGGLDIQVLEISNTRNKKSVKQLSFH